MWLTEKIQSKIIRIEDKNPFVDANLCLMKETIKVIIADECQAVLDRLSAVAIAGNDIKVLGQAYNGHHAFKVLELNQLDTDIVILDVGIPGMSRLGTVREIKAEFPHIEILVLSSYRDEAFIRQVMVADATGCVLKNKASDELVNAIRVAHRGEGYFGTEMPKLNALDKSSKKACKLTKREKEVLSLIGQGMTTKEMSKMLFIAATTVDTHRRHLIDKLGVKNSKELILHVAKNGVPA